MMKNGANTLAEKHQQNDEKSALIRKCAAIAAFIYVTFFIIASTFHYIRLHKILMDNKTTELHGMLENKRIRTSSYITAQITLARRLAKAQSIVSYCINPRNHAITKQALKEIESTSEDPIFHGSIFWASDEDKEFYFDDGNHYTVVPEDEDQYWYNMTLQGPEEGNININYNDVMDQMKLWINMPVYNEQKKAIGLVGTGVDLETFTKELTKDVGEKTGFYMFNEKSEVTIVKDTKDSDIIKNKMNIFKVLHNNGVLIEDLEKNINALSINKPNYFGRVQNMVYAVVLIPMHEEINWYGIAFENVGNTDVINNPMTWLFGFTFLAILLIFGTALWIIIWLINTLYSNLDSLKLASNAKSDFLAKMSHEIRTPMNAIMGMAELALNEELPNEARANVQTIKQAGVNLLAIINDILDFSKIETGKLEIILGNYLFSSLINDVVSIIRIRAGDSKIKFVVNIDSNIPNELFGDEIKIRQVMLNVLSNAVKYTETGHVSFSVTGEKIDENTVVLTITVEDTGKGIKAEDIGKIFDSFTQIDGERNKGIEGTGLGLPIARNLVEAMNGHIEVYSEYGIGSTFTVTLPQKFSDPTPLVSVAHPREKPVLVYETRQIFSESIVCTIDNLGVSCTLVFSDSEFYEKLASGKFRFAFVASIHYENLRAMCSEFAHRVHIILLADFGEIIGDRNLSVVTMPVTSISIASILNGEAKETYYSDTKESLTKFTAPGTTVLVVDDVNTNLHVAKGLLAYYEIDVTLCTSGSAAIEAVKSKEFDFVFMDHMMPGMDGVETTAHIRAMGQDDAYYKRLPIIALTANAISGVKEMFLANGFDDFLSKPIEMSQLAAVLERWVPKKKQKRQGPDQKELDQKEIDDPAMNSYAKDYDNPLGIEIDGINVGLGLARVGGNVEKFFQILSVFQQEWFEKIYAVKTAFDSNEIPLFITYVNALKSAAWNVGFTKLSKIAGSLEMAGNNTDIAFIQANLDDLFFVFQTTLASIRRALNKYRSRDGNLDISLLRTELADLKAAIELQDLAKVSNTTKKLRHFIHAPGIGSTIENILHQTLTGEFAEAIFTIDFLLQEKK